MTFLEKAKLWAVKKSEAAKQLGEGRQERWEGRKGRDGGRGRQNTGRRLLGQQNFFFNDIVRMGMLLHIPENPYKVQDKE